jgi:hypothetical protein
MEFDGFAADYEPLGNLLIGQPGRDEPGDHQLGGRELACPPALAPAAETVGLLADTLEIRPCPDPRQNGPRFGCLVGRCPMFAGAGEDDSVGGFEAGGLEGLRKLRRYRCRFVKDMQCDAGVVAVGLE